MHKWFLTGSFWFHRNLKYRRYYSFSFSFEVVFLPPLTAGDIRDDYCWSLVLQTAFFFWKGRSNQRRKETKGASAYLPLQLGKKRAVFWSCADPYFTKKKTSKLWRTSSIGSVSNSTGGQLFFYLCPYGRPLIVNKTPKVVRFTSIGSSY